VIPQLRVRRPRLDDLVQRPGGRWQCRRNSRERHFQVKLRDMIAWALGQLKKDHAEEAARTVAEQLDRQQFRLMTNVDVGSDGEPVADSLFYRVEVAFAGDWVPLVEAHWSALGVSEAGAADEARWAGLQHGLGVPDDASELTDPPST